MDVLAHRGARMADTGAPLVENTIAAFERAFELGADGIECDVHRTRDDVLVIHHDARVEGVGLIAECTSAHLRDARPEVPTLDATLDACRGRRCNVEIKNLPVDEDFDPEHRIAFLVADLLSARDDTEAVIVSSFNLATLDALHAHRDDIPTGWLINAGMDPLLALGIVVEHGLEALHPNVHLLSDGTVDELPARAHGLGIAVNVWTVNEPDAFVMLAARGYESVITDDVALARRTIAG